MELTRREFLQLIAGACGIGAAALAIDKLRNEPARERAEDERGEPEEPPP